MMRRPLNRQRLLQGLLLQGLLLPALTLPAPAEPTPQAAPRTNEADTAPATTNQPANESNNAPNPGAKREAQGNGKGESELSPKEKAVLQQIRNLKAPRWRRFGVCRYDWSTWKNEKDGVRATNAECGEPAKADRVAVHCATLKVSRQVGQEAWSKWRLPLSTAESSSTGGEDLMVAALCANALPEPKPEAKPEAKPDNKPETGTQGKPANSQPTGKGQPESKAKTGSTPGNKPTGGKPAGYNTNQAPAKR